MNCEEALLMKMAEFDGEQLRSLEADAHIAGCESCRHEVTAMESLDKLFEAHTAVRPDTTVWPEVREQITGQTSRVGWAIFAVPALALVAFKIVAMSLENEPGLLFGLVPLAIAAVLFALLRENPFRVNTDLILEK